MLRTGGRHCHLQLQGAALQALLGIGSAVKEKNLELLHAAVSADNSAYHHHIATLVLATTKLNCTQIKLCACAMTIQRTYDGTLKPPDLLSQSAQATEAQLINDQIALCSELNAKAPDCTRHRYQHNSMEDL